MTGKLEPQQSEDCPVGGATQYCASVIVPHYDDLDRLGLCLEALSSQALARPFEIIVVDNGSPLAWSAIEACVAGRAQLLLCEDKGAGPARNTGIAASSAPALAFVDSDCRPAPGWLAAGLAALDAFDLVGGEVELQVADKTITPVEAFEKVFAFRNKKYVVRDRFTVTANLFARRDVFHAVGGFKSAVSEDVEWSHRALAGGYRLGYEPAARVGHPARRSWHDLATKWRRTTREAFELARTRRGGRIRFLLRGWAVFFSILPHAFTIAQSRALTGWQQRLGAMRILVAIRAYRFLLAHRLVFKGR